MFGRGDILHYVSEKYKTVPEKLWPKKYPTFEILRHNHNKKWYALFGQVDAKYLGLEKGKKIDILNVKASPDFIEFLLAQPGFYPAYHMNKKNWITVVLDESVESEKIFQLIDASYNITV